MIFAHPAPTYIDFPDEDRKPLLPDGNVPFPAPVVVTMEVNGEAITSEGLKAGQAALRKQVRQATGTFH